eukprot:10532362-Alexandrium_andersonii.AAC.1
MCIRDSGELEILAARMRGAAVSGRGVASSPVAREANGPPAPGAHPKSEPTAGGQGTKLMTAGTKAFAKGPPPKQRAE